LHIGHNLPQEAPQAIAQAVVDVDGYYHVGGERLLRGGSACGSLVAPQIR
jgi:hypothetical protein